MTVFANWPTGSTPLRYVTSFDFSPHSGTTYDPTYQYAAHQPATRMHASCFRGTVAEGLVLIVLLLAVGGVLLGYFAVGNDRGKVLLYRLRHYDAF